MMGKFFLLDAVIMILMIIGLGSCISEIQSREDYAPVGHHCRAETYEGILQWDAVGIILECVRRRPIDIR